MLIKHICVLVFAIFVTCEAIDPPNISKWDVVPGEVAEVSLKIPHPIKLVEAMAWTYHIRLASNEEFTPIMWLGYPAYLPQDLEINSGEECSYDKDSVKFNTHHMLQVTYREDGYHVKMTRFLGNETSEVVLIEHPTILLFSTKDNCYKGEMLVYETHEGINPKSRRKLSRHHSHEHDHSDNHAHHDHSHEHDDRIMPYDNNEPQQGYLRERGRGTRGPPTPISEPETSWIPVIVICSMIGIAVLYYGGKAIFKKPKPQPGQVV